MNKTALVFGLAIACLAALTSCNQPAPVVAPPESPVAISTAKLVEMSHDHGELNLGEPASGSFEVENTGAAPFTIAQIKTTCACTTAADTQDLVPPGGKASISYSMKARGNGDQSVGIYVDTEPPLREPLHFTAKASWTAPILIDADFMQFRISQGQYLDKFIPIKRAEGQEPLSVQAIESHSTEFTAELVNLDGTEENLPSLHIKSVAPVEPGTWLLPVTLTYEQDGEKHQNVQFQIEGTARLRIRPRPFTVRFGEGEESSLVRLRLNDAMDEPFLVRSVVAHNCEMQPPSLPTEPGQSHIVELTFRRPADLTHTKATLEIDAGETLGKQTVNIVFAERKPKMREAVRPNVIRTKPARASKKKLEAGDAPEPGQD